MPSLNQDMTPDREGGDQTQCLTFLLGEEMFAVPILNVREIIEHGHITVVPMMPDAIRGVINLRGAVVPVVDLNRRFGRGHTKEGKRTCIVIVEIPRDTETLVVGMMVDAVSEVLDIPASQVEPPPAFGTHLRTDFIQGMAKMEDGFIVLLALTHVLSDEELAQLPGDTPVATVH